MKILQVNAVYDKGSTGKIAKGINEIAEQNGFQASFSVPKTKLNKKIFYEQEYIKIGTYYGRCLSVLLARFTGFNECFSFFATLKFLRKVKKYNPDIIHLHNLHGWYLNLPLLFKYIKKHNIRVVWTLHDCWTFTGHCPHFDMIGCDKWRTGCYKCPQYKAYPKSYVDRSKSMYKLKKKWFTGVRDMTLVTPSRWLADLVKQSFLKDYPVKVIHNGIDLSVFKPTESEFRKKYNCENKFVLLGVAFGWGQRKGLDVFLELAKRLDENYQIVLAGTDKRVDKLLPENIISIHRTQNQTELAEIYSAADLFVMPTREDNFPTVNIESLACGTPIVTFRTGGSPECIDETCGSVVEKNDIDGLEKEIRRIYEEKPFKSAACVERAKQFDMNDKFKEYVDLYGRK